jgi:hypothetical protein
MHLKSIKKIKLSPKSKEPRERLEWPRVAEDGVTILGINIEEKRKDIIRIVYKFFKVPDVPMEELLQEIYTAIMHKNYTRSAHNPLKSSFSHYVYMISNNVCINLVQRKKRTDRERESIDSPVSQDDDRTLLDTVDIEDSQDEIQCHLDNIEEYFREAGLWDLARYIRASRSGAAPNVIREAMSWGNRKITTKVIRDIREQITEHSSMIC